MSLDDATRELIAIGASVAANNPPEIKCHIVRAREHGVQDAELNAAVEIGRLVRNGAASKTDLFASSLATTPVERTPGACPRGRLNPGAGRGNGCGCAS